MAPKSPAPLAELQKAATGAFAAFTIASSVLTVPLASDALVPSALSSSQVLAEKVIREGIYGEYEVDLPDQKFDDARSTFKSAQETKSKKGKSCPILRYDLHVQSILLPRLFITLLIHYDIHNFTVVQENTRLYLLF